MSYGIGDYYQSQVRRASERQQMYQQLVNYYVVMEKMSIDDAHRKVDAIVKFLRYE